MPEVKDMAGQVYGRLTVTHDYALIKRVDGRGSRTKWRCKCNCGTEKWVLRDLLLNSHTQSCGCIITDTKKANYGKARKNDLYATYKYNASLRDLCFDLSTEEFHELTQSNCYYCNRIPSQIKKAKTDNGDHIYNGVDRKNNGVGYTNNNSVSCCKHCNYAKGTLSLQEFLEHIKKIYLFGVKNGS